ncbi:unnamed protein product [Trichobilharzia regenti]|nr:unnamed protein product [Trichobilharzia regenti]
MNGARESLNIPWAGGDDSVAAQAARDIELHLKDTRMTRRERARLSQPRWLEEEFLEIVPALRAIWADPSIQTAFDQRSKIITENFVFLFFESDNDDWKLLYSVKRLRII